MRLRNACGGEEESMGLELACSASMWLTSEEPSFAPTSRQAGGVPPSFRCLRVCGLPQPPIRGRGPCLSEDFWRLRWFYKVLPGLLLISHSTILLRGIKAFIQCYPGAPPAGQKAPARQSQTLNGPTPHKLQGLLRKAATEGSNKSSLGAPQNHDYYTCSDRKKGGVPRAGHPPQKPEIHTISSRDGKPTYCPTAYHSLIAVSLSPRPATGRL
jgi:hypothetical protein